MSWGELAITALFDVEIIWRIVASLPDWRTFFSHGHNWLDLTLAVACEVLSCYFGGTENETVDAHCVWQHVWSGQHVPLLDPGQLYLPLLLPFSYFGVIVKDVA
ncbi:hypothetical protein MPER_02707 [Moniliophthora perniciosa FA553]|nr:hypothetical protein MPER_02707 [Moniliophthora perniciosa FA553]